MAVSVSLQQNLTVGTRSIQKANSYSNEAVIDMNFDVADSETDYQVDVAVDVSQAKLIYIVSDQAVTLEQPADGSIVQESLLANVPLLWTHNGYHANLFTGDFAALFFSNASGSSANIDVVIVYDATV